MSSTAATPTTVPGSSSTAQASSTPAAEPPSPALEVVDRGDAIATRVPLNYFGENITVHFDMAPAGTIVVEQPDGPVAIHLVLSP